MHTSRLRKKVEQADDGAYGNLNESFVSVGTALPSLASTSKKDQNDFKPLWEQEVYDEQGRRRLHGAFTGGFSAGYFNTVGSKEGWTPSTFKSSRSSRAQAPGRTTEEMAKSFMDEEDLTELASARKLETSATYAPQSQQPTYDPLMGIFGPSGEESTAVPASAALASLIEPASTRVGAKLMRKMGWREGQGVGPRVTHAQRKAQAAELGVQLDAEEDDDDETADGETVRHYFAPLDRPQKVLQGVSVTAEKGWGLGYKAGPNMAQALGTDGSSSRRAAGMAMAFDEDDEDNVYGDEAVDLPSSRLKVMEVGEADHDFGRRGKSRRPEQLHPRDEPKTFHDGARVLPGFVVDAEISPSYANSYIPPQPPRGWLPDPTRVWAEASTSASVKGKGKQLDADERGTLLGEPTAPVMPKSVFEYLSAKDKERLAAFTAPGSRPSKTTVDPNMPQAIPDVQPDAQLFIPPLDKVTALAALKGFQPFGTTSTSPDPARQARYTLYLQHCADVISSPGATLPFGPRKLPNGQTQTISELNRELDDYAKAAKVFKPVSGMLAGRFTSGGAGALGPKVSPGLYQPPAKDTSSASAAEGPQGVEPVLVENLTAAQKAVRAGRYGDETRTVTRWRPAKLVCKRFGQRDPHEGGDQGDDGDQAPGGSWGEATAKGWSTGEPTRSTKEALGRESMDALRQSAGFRQFQPAEPEAPLDMADVLGEKLNGSDSKPYSHEAAKKRKADPPTLETVGLGDDESQGQETLTYTRAPKDIFAAIFADSDDEDDGDDDGEEEEEDVADGLSTAPSSKTAVFAPSVAENGSAITTLQATTTAAEEEAPQPQLSISNVANYRPSFVPVAARSTPAAANVASSVEKKDKKKKDKKRKATTTLSFDMDDDGTSSAPVKVKKSKRARDGRPSKPANEAEAADDVDEWEEAAPTVHADVLKAAARSVGQDNSVSEAETAVASKARSRASDLF